MENSEKVTIELTKQELQMCTNSLFANCLKLEQDGKKGAIGYTIRAELIEKFNAILSK